MSDVKYLKVRPQALHGEAFDCEEKGCDTVVLASDYDALKAELDEAHHNHGETATAFAALIGERNVLEAELDEAKADNVRFTGVCEDWERAYEAMRAERNRALQNRHVCERATDCDALRAALSDSLDLLMVLKPVQIQDEDQAEYDRLCAIDNRNAQRPTDQPSLCPGCNSRPCVCECMESQS